MIALIQRVKSASVIIQKKKVSKKSVKKKKLAETPVDASKVELDWDGTVLVKEESKLA